ncbi:MAG: DNA mismatch repair protein MutS, partial [Nitrospinaceae bacterium]|nr:DNA mismatch repair protein MutS [Nitrospinaceae bacterium]
LLEAGHKVAICEQVGAPVDGKGIVKREVVRVLTPGTANNPQLIDGKSSCYLAGLAPGSGKLANCWGVAWMDLSTGEFSASEIIGEHAGAILADALERIRPREMLLPPGAEIPQAAERRISELGARIEHRPKSNSHSSALDLLREQFGEGKEIESDINGHPLASIAAADLLEFSRENQPGNFPHLRKINFQRMSDTMLLDAATQRNLELVRSQVDGGRRGTLLDLMDDTNTAMGARLLRRWVLSPLITLKAVKHRADAVDEFVQDPASRRALRDSLSRIQDFERILGRIAIQTANARDLLALGTSLAALPALREALSNSNCPYLRDILDDWDSLEDVSRKLCESIVDSPPLTIRDGGIIRDGLDPELDRYREAGRSGKSWLESYANDERERTGLPVKVGFNKVFGFYLELPKRFSEEAPLEYTRKQTLVSAERYITEELKKIEDDVLGAEEKAKELEYRLFGQLRVFAASEAHRILRAAERVALLDATAALAEIAQERGYVRPHITEDLIIDIKEGRHPVMEADLSSAFVPNDLHVGEERQILIVTGPNMAGKSTFLRQSALIILMAQIGSFVPAKSAQIGLVDRVFTRVGAHDRLLEGQSTFMVEMVETATILREATQRSFVVLDEVGRGTSTYDGVSIAWAVVEYLHDYEDHRARTLFATHYHEMAELSKQLSRVSNLTVEVREWGEEVVFLRKVSEGSSDRSYGIHVGRLAGLPTGVIDRAREILAGLEVSGNSPISVSNTPNMDESTCLPANSQLSLFDSGPSALECEFMGIDPDTLTPKEALDKLYYLKSLINLPLSDNKA